MLNPNRAVAPLGNPRRRRRPARGPHALGAASRALACALGTTARRLEHWALGAIVRASPSPFDELLVSGRPSAGQDRVALRPVGFASISSGLRPASSAGDDAGGADGSGVAMPRRADPEERILVSEVEVVGLDGALKAIAEGALVTKPNFAYTLAEIQEDLNRVFATGYFQEIRPEPEDTRDGVKLSLIVKANPELKSIVSTGGDVLPQVVFEDAFRGLHGRTLNFNTFGDAVRKIVGWYEDAGVLGQVMDVSFTEGQANVQFAEATVGRVDLRFLDAKTGDIKDDGSVRSEVVLRQMATRDGSVYNMRQGKRDVEAIYSTGLFDDVNITPQSSPGMDPQRPKVDLVVNLRERKTGGMTCGAGVSGQSHTEGALPGFIGNISYNQKNLFSLGQRLTASMEFGQIDKLFKLQHTDPWILGDRYRTSRTMGMMNTRTSGNPIYGHGESAARGSGVEWGNTIIGRLIGTCEFSRPLPVGWSATVGVSAQRVTLMDDNNRAVRQDFAEAPVNCSGDYHDHMVAGFVRAAFGGLDNTQLVVSAEKAINIRPDWLNISKLQARAEKLVSLGPVSLMAYGKGGMVLGNLPPYEAFPLGGTNSVRGYVEGGVGTARHYLEGTAELHVPLVSNIQGTLFADYGTDLKSGPTVIGNPANNRGKPGKGYGYGVGFRVDSPVGPLRLEWAWNQERNRRFHVGLGFHG
ncbi:unnamed protein product [Ostreobium quekettii]|uniref:POTRA domain-containing protein n=1 Tax=Ostreobium quekettii TaxID=121088 RepID=A0A8S1IPK9_9CHLO|nr:unnamed protein product [Ostreobium quekettii]|eukprot:evm.model.scf_3134.2 EVM.evm.TU.scf_3134.2   scf_3134:7122-9936(+)